MGSRNVSSCPPSTGSCAGSGAGTFLFAIDGNRIHGRLDLQDGTRYRVIEVERVR